MIYIDIFYICTYKYIYIYILKPSLKTFGLNIWATILIQWYKNMPGYVYIYIRY